MPHRDQGSSSRSRQCRADRQAEESAPAATFEYSRARVQPHGIHGTAQYLARFNAPQAILLWDGEEIAFAIDRRKICDYLIEKYYVCVESGIPYFDIRMTELPSGS